MIASLPEVPEYCRHKNTLEHSGYVQQKAHILPSLTMNDVHDTYFVILQLKIYIPMRQSLTILPALWPLEIFYRKNSGTEKETIKRKMKNIFQVFFISNKSIEMTFQGHPQFNLPINGVFIHAPTHPNWSSHSFSMILLEYFSKKC